MLKHKEKFSLTMCRLLTVLFLAVTAVAASAQRVGIKTNALYWATATANLGLEFRLNRHLTLNLEGGYHKLYFVNRIDTRAEFADAEMRYWFSARPQAGHFVGLMGVGGNYDLTLSHKCHVGDAIGFGPTYGYSFVLGRHWSLETTVGVGAVYQREKHYDESFEPVPETPNRRKWIFSPIKAGVTFVYIIR